MYNSFGTMGGRFGAQQMNFGQQNQQMPQQNQFFMPPPSLQPPQSPQQQQRNAFTQNNSAPPNQKMQFPTNSMMQMPPPFVGQNNMYPSSQPIQAPPPFTGQNTRYSASQPMQMPPPFTGQNTRYSASQPMQMPPPFIGQNNMYPSSQPIQAPPPFTGQNTRYSASQLMQMPPPFVNQNNMYPPSQPIQAPPPFTGQNTRYSNNSSMQVPPSFTGQNSQMSTNPSIQTPPSFTGQNSQMSTNPSIQTPPSFTGQNTQMITNQPMKTSQSSGQNTQMRTNQPMQTSQSSGQNTQMRTNQPMQTSESSGQNTQMRTNSPTQTPPPFTGQNVQNVLNQATQVLQSTGQSTQSQTSFSEQNHLSPSGYPTNILPVAASFSTQTQSQQPQKYKDMWDSEKLANMQLRDIETLSKCPWNPAAWCSCYKSLENKAEARARLITLASKYTVDFIREKKPMVQVRVFGDEVHINPQPSYTARSSVAFMADQDISHRSEGNATSMDFAKTVSPTMRGTDIYVMNADVLDIAEQVGRSNSGGRKSVLAVNACDPTSHGGGWLSGKCGHEEDLMIRSELCAVLGEYKYPLHERMLVFAKDVGVVRGSMETGYPFLDSNSQWKVDTASIANRISAPSASLSAQVFSMQIRLEMILRTALEHKYTVVVLPIFGGMATPGHAAMVTSEVFHAFAGCFERIFIAASKKYYDESVIDHYASVLTPHVSSDTWKKGSGNIQDYTPENYAASASPLPHTCFDINLPPCPHWEKCVDVSVQHLASHTHPCMCPAGESCPNKDPVHLTMYVHITPCKDGATCSLAVTSVSGTADPNSIAVITNHMKVFSHPKPCSSWEFCSETSEEHLNEFLHPPMCPAGHKCSERGDPVHMKTNRHILKPCPAGTYCGQYANSEHLMSASHPFKPPCPNGPRCDLKGCDKYSHLCPNGPKCNKVNDPLHIVDWIHPGKECKCGSSCTDLTEEHLGSYYHSAWNLQPFRPMCTDKWCTKSDPKHRRQLEHYPFWLAPSPVLMLSVIDPIPDANSRHEAFCFDIMGNGKDWESKVSAYANGAMPDESSENFMEIKKWFETMQPNHMCSAKTFLSIANLGNYTSLALLKDFWVKKNDLIEAVMQGTYTKHLFKLNGVNSTDEETLSLIRKYGRKYIRYRQGEISRDEIKNYQTKPNALSALNSSKPVSSSKNISRLEARATLCVSTSDEFVDEFEKHISKILGDVLVLIADPPGIGNTKNIEVRTNYTVFTVVGPHYGKYDGSEVVMVLKREIMHHPDFYMCPCSVLNYQDGDFMSNRPWVRSSEKGHRGYFEELDREKVAGFTPDWATAAAKEWIARVHKNTGKAFDKVTIVDVVENWVKLGCWSAIEGHLPYRVPIEYTDHIIFTKAAHDMVLADSTGSIILREWERLYGKSFIKVVPGPEEVRVETAMYHLSKNISPIGSPKGMCFCLDRSSYEKVLPMYLPTNDKAHFWVTFTARGPFYFSLSTDCIVTNPSRRILTFAVKDNDASAYYVMPSICVQSKMVALCPGFNAMLPQDRFTQYSVEVDYGTKQITFAHWGPASAVSSAKFVVPMMGGVRYKYVSFAGNEDVIFYPIIWDLRYSIKEPICVIEPVESGKTIVPQLQQQAPTQDPPKFVFKFGSDAKAKSTISLPNCAEPFGCTKANNRNEADHSSHIRQCSHVCKYGRICRSIKDPKHTLMFHHMDKSPCPDEPKCMRLTDPVHRFQYFHKGLADFLLPCWDGQGCNKINDPTHCVEYFHDPKYTYPPLSSVKLLN